MKSAGLYAGWPDERAARLVSELVRSLTDIEAQNARSTDNLVIVSPAVLPDRPVQPKPLLNLGIIGDFNPGVIEHDTIKLEVQ